MNEAAFDVLLGRVTTDKRASTVGNNTIVCAHIVPAIFSALHTGLVTVARGCEVPEGRWFA